MCAVHTCALYTNVHVHLPDEESYICNKLETAVQVLLVCLVPLWATLYMYMYVHVYSSCSAAWALQLLCWKIAISVL